MVRLLGILFTQEADFTPDPSKQERALRQILAHSDSGTLLVARQASGAVIGMVSLLYLISTACGGRVALLEDLVVDPALRGGGIGQLLVDAAIAHAEAVGCHRITLLTDNDNHAAQRFYARAGFRPSAMRVLRR
jgi:ribosomal protein S18 acetylase RimI-like enzyme